MLNQTSQDLERQSLIERAGDLQARIVLNDLGMKVLDEGDLEFGSTLLMHAEIYLADRLAYELFREDVIRDHWNKVRGFIKEAR